MNGAISYTPADRRIIQWQLGVDSVYLAGVIERCDYGYPRIMLLNPVAEDDEEGKLNYSAISNCLWLTCPYLNDRIHRLEQSGLITDIAEFIRSDNELMARMNNAHARFYFFRKNLYGKYYTEEVPQEILHIFNSGVGGIRDIAMIKCLHAHFSHYRICDDNVVGRITASLLDYRFNCDNGKCKNADQGR